MDNWCSSTSRTACKIKEIQRTLDTTQTKEEERQIDFFFASLSGTLYTWKSFSCTIFKYLLLFWEPFRGAYFLINLLKYYEFFCSPRCWQSYGVFKNEIHNTERNATHEEEEGKANSTEIGSYAQGIHRVLKSSKKSHFTNFQILRYCKFHCHSL